MAYLIIGLGNPGKRYEATRHNIGFMVVNRLAAQLEIAMKQKSFNAIMGQRNRRRKSHPAGLASNIHEFEWYCGQATAVVL